MVIVIKKNHSLILLRISGPFIRIYLLFFIASKCVKIIFKPFIGTCIPFQTSITVCDTVQNETWIAMNNFIPTSLVQNYA